MSIPKHFQTEKTEYDRVKQIGQGGSGTVFCCYDVKEKSVKYAVKFLNPKDNASNKQKRFEKELNFQQNSKCKNIIPCLDYGYTDDGILFYIMPLYEETLRDVMNKKCSDQRKIELFLGLCNAVKYAHTHKIIHRDIKPENVMVNGNNAVLGDFGIAQFRDCKITKKSERLGNFAYSAPEQKIKGTIKIGPESDIYSLGLILNELFTGALPIGNNPRRILFESPIYGFLDDIVDTMIVSDQNHREKNVQLVINKIQFEYENTNEDFKWWKNHIKLPDYAMHSGNGYVVVFS